MVQLLLPPVRKRSGPYSYSPAAHTGHKPGNKVAMTVEHNALLVHDVLLLTRFDNVNLLQLLHGVRLRRVGADLHLCAIITPSWKALTEYKPLPRRTTACIYWHQRIQGPCKNKYGDKSVSYTHLTLPTIYSV